ncbi:MAG: site-2 protease family protein [Candidatus Margulisbacteria bacterium]|nr:site-2 protease family protein [Candidatus Margulisiibacteriota bacterium]
MEEFVFRTVVLVPIILICVSIHEYAHAKVADMLGDPTPRQAGRLTLNPISHIDPIGLIMLIIARIGWARPVPVNPYNFKNPEWGMTMVGLAGPVSNFFFAWVLAVIFRFLPGYSSMAHYVIYQAIFINLALMVFNLLPIPPLDGSRIYTQYLPSEWQFFLERYGFIILVAFIILPPTQMLLFTVIQFFLNLLL